MTLPDRILVVGAYGYRNVGDEAILAGLLTTVAGRRVTVVSRSPAETSALHGVEAVPIQRALHALRAHRTVLIGGGGLFGSDMGSIGRALPAFGILARSLGRTVRVEGVGVDPAIGGAQRRLVRRLLRDADAVTVRDDASARLIGSWGIDARVAGDLSAQMPDVASRIGRDLLRTAGVDQRRPVIGLCLTSVNASVTPAVTSAIVALIRRHPELQFCFIPMSQHPFVDDHNDLILAGSLQARCPELKVLPGAHHPAAVLSVFGALTAVVAMRYHGLLFAERAGIPLIPVSHADKCLAWLSERGMRPVEPNLRALSRALAAAQPARSKAS